MTFCAHDFTRDFTHDFAVKVNSNIHTGGAKNETDAIATKPIKITAVSEVQRSKKEQLTNTIGRTRTIIGCTMETDRTQRSFQRGEDI